MYKDFEGQRLDTQTRLQVGAYRNTSAFSRQRLQALPPPVEARDMLTLEDRAPAAREEEEEEWSEEEVSDDPEEEEEYMEYEDLPGGEEEARGGGRRQSRGGGRGGSGGGRGGPRRQGPTKEERQAEKERAKAVKAAKKKAETALRKVQPALASIGSLVRHDCILDVPTADASAARRLQKSLGELEGKLQLLAKDGEAEGALELYNDFDFKDVKSVEKKLRAALNKAQRAAMR